VLLKVAKLKYSDIKIDENLSKNQKVAILRGAAISSLSYLVMKEFSNNLDLILNGEYKGALLDNLGDEVKNILKEVNEIYEKLYSKKSEMEFGAYEIVNVLLKTFVDSVYKFHYGDIGKKEELSIKILGNFRPLENLSYFENLHRVMDFIAGMTDNYALYLANQLRGNFKG
jgi:dGTPase